MTRLRCIVRTRPKVSGAAASRKSGQCSLSEAIIPKVDPSTSHTTAPISTTVTGQADTESIPARAVSKWCGTRSSDSGATPASSGCPSSPSTKIVEALRRSEEHTSELQSLMRISYAVFCLKKKNKRKKQKQEH